MATVVQLHTSPEARQFYRDLRQSSRMLAAVLPETPEQALMDSAMGLGMTVMPAGAVAGPVAVGLRALGQRLASTFRVVQWLSRQKASWSMTAQQWKNSVRQLLGRPLPVQGPTVPTPELIEAMRYVSYFRKMPSWQRLPQDQRKSLVEGFLGQKGLDQLAAARLSPLWKDMTFEQRLTYFLERAGPDFEHVAHHFPSSPPASPAQKWMHDALRPVQQPPPGWTGPKPFDQDFAKEPALSLFPDGWKPFPQ